VPTPHPLLPAALQEEYRRLGYWEDRTLAEIVREWAERDPRRVAVTGPEPFTYDELWRSAQGLAAKLCEEVQPGEFVLAVLPNSWQGIVLAVAASAAGVGLAPLSPRVSPTLAQNVLDQTGARMIVLHADLLDREGWREFADGAACRVLLTNGAFETAAGSGVRCEQRAWDPGRPSLVLSTGGTTGRAKGVMLSHHNVLSDIEAIAHELGRSGQRFASVSSFRKLEPTSAPPVSGP